GVISRAGEDVFQFITNNSLLRAGAVDLREKVAPTDREAALAQLAEANVGFFIIDKALLNESYLMGESLLNLNDWRQFMVVEPIYEDDYLVVYPTAAQFSTQES